MMNAADVTLDVLSYLQANVYNVGCGTVATYSPNIVESPFWHWTGLNYVNARTFFLGDRPDQQMFSGPTNRFAVR